MMGEFPPPEVQPVAPEDLRPIQEWMIARTSQLKDGIHSLMRNKPLKESSSDREKRETSSEVLLAAKIIELGYYKEGGDNKLLLNYLCTEVKDYDISRLEPDKTALFVSLGAITFQNQRKPDNVRVSDLKTILSPFREEGAKRDFNREFNQFLDDLEIIELVEKKGIKGVNDQMASLLGRMRSQDLPVDEQKETIEEANKFLERAIFLFPHLVQSVEVGVKQDLEEIRDNTVEGVSGPDWNKRSEFTDYRDYYQRTSGSPLSVISVPLPKPYLHHPIRFTGRHPRDAKGKTIYEKYIPFMEVNTSGFGQGVMFTTGEVESVRLADKENYTPFYQEDYSTDPPSFRLDEREGWMDQYLTFRRFSNRAGGGRGILESNQRGLWLQGDVEPLRILGKNKAGGYFVSAFEKDDGTTDYTLVEVDGYKLPKGISAETEIGPVIWNDISEMQKAGRQPPEGITLYKGKDILRTLAAIPATPLLAG